MPPRLGLQPVEQQHAADQQRHREQGQRQRDEEGRGAVPGARPRSAAASMPSTTMRAADGGDDARMSPARGRPGGRPSITARGSKPGVGVAMAGSVPAGPVDHAPPAAAGRWLRGWPGARPGVPGVGHGERSDWSRVSFAQPGGSGVRRDPRPRVTLPAGSDRASEGSADPTVTTRRRRPGMDSRRQAGRRSDPGPGHGRGAAGRRRAPGRRR